MEENILAPKYLKKKKPVKVRKPSRPIDGINHRLLAQQATQVLEEVAAEVSPCQMTTQRPPASS